MPAEIFERAANRVAGGSLLDLRQPIAVVVGVLGHHARDPLCPACEVPFGVVLVVVLIVRLQPVVYADLIAIAHAIPVCIPRVALVG